MGQLNHLGGLGNNGISEGTVRRIVREEMDRKSNQSRFQLNSIPQHTHNGVDSPLLKEENIIPSVSVSGSVTMTSIGIYTLNLNASFTPKHIMAYGNAFNAVPPDYSGLTVRAMSVGSANLTPSFYFQPNDSQSVVTGNIQYPFPTEQPDGTYMNVPVQSSVYLATIQGGSPAARSLSSEGHIASVEYPGGTIHARVTVVGFDKNAVYLSVPYLDSGWSITINYIIT